MSLHLERYTELLKPVWDEFITTKAKNATFLHTRNFYDHNPLNESDDCSFIVFKNDKPVALFPAILYENSKRILHSFLRATYGGLIIGNDLATQDLIAIIDIISETARALKIDEIIIRPSFRIYHSTLADEIDYALWKCGYVIKQRELELAIDLETEIKQNYNDATYRSIKKAIKQGVVVNEASDYAAYWQMLEANLMERYGTRPVHNLEEINRLKVLVGEEKVRLFVSLLEEQIIGGIVVFVANQRVVHAQYIASDNQFQQYRPLNAVIDHIARWAQSEGYKYFNLGMASEPGGKEINEGLMRFKEGFGARGVLRETMHLQL